jgi:accessory colonization factor AcfC
MLRHTKAVAILALAASAFAGSVRARAVINVYGPGGPAPAMQEAART